MHIGPCLLLHPLVLICVSSLVCGCECIHMCASLSILCGVCFGTIIRVHVGMPMHVAACRLVLYFTECLFVCACLGMHVCAYV